VKERSTLRAAFNPVRLGIGAFFICLGVSLSLSSGGFHKEIPALALEAIALALLVTTTLRTEGLLRHTGTPLSSSAAIYHVIPPALCALGTVAVALLAIGRALHWEAGFFVAGVFALIMLLFAIAASPPLILRLSARNPNSH